MGFLLIVSHKAIHKSFGEIILTLFINIQYSIFFNLNQYNLLPLKFLVLIKNAYNPTVFMLF